MRQDRAIGWPRSGPMKRFRALQRPRLQSDREMAAARSNLGGCSAVGRASGDHLDEADGRSSNKSSGRPGMLNKTLAFALLLCLAFAGTERPAEAAMITGGTDIDLNNGYQCVEVGGGYTTQGSVIELVAVLGRLQPAMELLSRSDPRYRVGDQRPGRHHESELHGHRRLVPRLARGVEQMHRRGEPAVGGPWRGYCIGVPASVPGPRSRLRDEWSSVDDQHVQQEFDPALRDQIIDRLRLSAGEP